MEFDKINQLINNGETTIKKAIEIMSSYGPNPSQPSLKRLVSEYKNWQSDVRSLLEEYDPDLIEKIDNSFQQLESKYNLSDFYEITATLQEVKECLALHGLIWYGNNNVRRFLQDMHDMELGINNHYSEFSFKDYKRWEKHVIDYFEYHFICDSSEIEDLFRAFETKYDEVAFSEIMTYLNNAYHKLKLLTKLSHKKMENQKSKVLIVHSGHNELYFSQTEAFLMQLGLEPIILQKQLNQGLTIIERLEKKSDVAYAIVLYTSCDIGRENKTESKLKPHAHQNVVFEHGFLIAKLGRIRVCALIEDGVELPSDLAGVVYTPIDKKGAWKTTVAKEMKAVGLNIDMNNL